MRRALSFLLLLLLSAPLFAQNWQTVNPSDTVYFKCTTATGLGAVRMIMVDSAIGNNGDSLFYFYKTLRVASLLSQCVDTVAPSWMGPQCLRHADGEEIYFNGQNDTIHINTKAALADSWVIGKDTLGNIYYAAVANVDTATIDGVLDSVKLCTIQATYGGSPVPSYYDTFTVKWSKNHGWVSTLDWYAFPNAITQQQTWGAQMLPCSFERLPMIFNAIDFSQEDLLWKYAPGNAWFRAEDLTPLYSPGPPHMVYTYDSVISSSITSSNTLLVTLNEVRHVTTYKDSAYQLVLDSNVTTSTVLTNTISLSSSSSYNPVASYVYPDLKPLPVGMIPTISSYRLTSFCGDRYLFSDSSSDMAVITPSSPNGCLIAANNISAGLWGNNVYLEGFGKIASNMNEYFGTGITHRDMAYTYLKLGNCVMGSMASMTQYLGVNNVQIVSKTIAVSPNPATNIVNIVIPQTSVQLAVYDVTGRVVRSEKLVAGINTLSVVDLPTGLYILRFSGSSVNYTYKLIKN